MVMVMVGVFLTKIPMAKYLSPLNVVHFLDMYNDRNKRHSHNDFLMFMPIVRVELFEYLQSHKPTRRSQRRRKNESVPNSRTCVLVLFGAKCEMIYW